MHYHSIAKPGLGDIFQLTNSSSAVDVKFTIEIKKTCSELPIAYEVGELFPYQEQLHI